MFSKSASELRQIIIQDRDYGRKVGSETPELILAHNLGTSEEIEKLREETSQQFLNDFALAPVNSCYRAASLPNLPFAERSFDVALSGHLLFGYSNILSQDFHLAAVSELVRVTSGEVRIFPIRGFDTELSPYLGPVCQELE
jgi:hypothetical protein